jgi:hypothetical protein
MCCTCRRAMYSLDLLLFADREKRLFYCGSIVRVCPCIGYGRRACGLYMAVMSVICIDPSWLCFGYGRRACGLYMAVMSAICIGSSCLCIVYGRCACELFRSVMPVFVYGRRVGELGLSCLCNV